MHLGLRRMDWGLRDKAGDGEMVGLGVKMVKQWGGKCVKFAVKNILSDCRIDK